MKTLVQAVCAAALLIAGGRPVAAQSPPPPEMSDTLRISVEECKQALAKKTAVAVDVRGDPAFRAGHIAGAVLAPGGSDLKALAEELKKSGRSAITYCS